MIRKDALLIDLKTSSKNAILTKMGLHLTAIYGISSPDILISKILERESEISTGIGFGIAIPHVRTNEVDNVCMIIGRCIDGIEFDSLDENPVKLLFMLASPQKKTDEHRHTLSLLSKIMSYSDIREKLVNAKDTDSFINFLIDAENRYIK